jgi:hypothetical protein
MTAEATPRQAAEAVIIRPVAGDRNEDINFDSFVEADTSVSNATLDGACVKRRNLM